VKTIVTVSFPTRTLSTPLLTEPRWQPATWQDYVLCRDECDRQPDVHHQLFFHQGKLLVISGEGINHAAFADLFTMMFGFWMLYHPQETLTSLGRCLMEKEGHQAAAPDLVLYKGESVPRWAANTPRRINLDQWRVPDLVGEISDTSLASDLDEKKQLYAALQIPEYWVVDVRGDRIFAFQLQETGFYQPIDRSGVLTDLPIALLAETIDRLKQDPSNVKAALWLAQQVSSLLNSNAPNQESSAIQS
jgi:Uma2 family endonuclease